MKPLWDVLREFLLALWDALLALPRQGLAFLQQKKRLSFFQTLTWDAPPPPAPTVSRVSGTIHHLFLSCGDASGEGHALRLLHQLKKNHPHLRVSGFGGARLQKAGMKIWEPLADKNVMGFRDVLAQLPLFIRCVFRFSKELHQHKPDAVILVDYPGLHRHLLRIAHRAKVPVIDFIAPQLWAWSPWRIRDFKKADALLTILPFERSWYEAHGAPAAYVGHPLGDCATSMNPLPKSLAALTDGIWVGLLPGSRRREVEENLPLLMQAAKKLHQEIPEAQFVLPHLRPEIYPFIQELLSQAEFPILFAKGEFQSVLPHLQGAWVTSGTAVLEVAAHQVPPILVYHLSSRWKEWLSRRWLSVPWIGGLNLLAGEQLAPEHVGVDISPHQLAKDMQKYLHGPQRTEFLEKLKPHLPAFADPGSAARAADAVNQAVFPPFSSS